MAMMDGDRGSDMERSTTCVVTELSGDTNTLCGEPVVGERAGWPMCELHHRLFAPSSTKDGRKSWR